MSRDQAAIADFSIDETARLCRVSTMQLTNWDRKGFVQASIPAKRRGISRRYSFRDVVALRVAAELREAGISLQQLRKVVEHLRNREGLSATEVLARTQLVVDGDEVHEVTGGREFRVPSGQRVMVYVAIPLDAVVEDIQRKARALRRAA